MRRLSVFLVIVALVLGTVGCADLVMFDVDPNTGELLETIILTSSDEMLTATIPDGTVALDEEGNPLLALEIDNDPDPPAPPEDAHIIGLAYDLSPAGATFDPAMTLTWKYGPGDVPEGVDEENLVIAYYDEAADEWVILESVVDTATNTVAASASHLTTFAIVGVPPVQYNLTISSTAGGNVTTPGEGTFTYDEGTLVNLVADPDDGYQFVNWGNDIAMIGSVNATSTTITVDGNYSIIANFERIPPVQYSLNISSTAGGSVTEPGEGMFTYNASTVVNLMANPLGGYYFQNWTGDVTTVANVDAASTTITMSGNYSITANFSEVPVTYYTLTVAINGSGSTSPSVGQHSYAAGTLVSISITPGDCHRFVNWTGNVGTVGNVNAASTTIRMNGHYSITANLQQEEPVYFPDPNLEACVRWPINTNKPDGPICPSDLEGLTCLYASMSISDLTGLEYCISLTELHLDKNQITDLSPLANLTSLRELDLRENQITDISLLTNFTNLTTLDLRDNQVSDISPLAGITALTGLYLGYNRISNVSPVSSLINLRWLHLDSNQIGNISPLANLTNLQALHLRYNQISDIASLANLTELITLNLDSNQICDISSLVNLTDLEYLHLNGNQVSDVSPLANLTTSLDELQLNNNQLSDISPLANLTKLDELQLNNNQISNLPPMDNLTNLRHLLLNNNQISDISPLANLTNLDGRLELRVNQISDISPLASIIGMDWLWLGSNQISDISPLASLTNLHRLYLEHNQISDIGPLVQNDGLGMNDLVDLQSNPLSSDSISVYIPQLEARGVIVEY